MALAASGGQSGNERPQQHRSLTIFQQARHFDQRHLGVLTEASLSRAPAADKERERDQREAEQDQRAGRSERSPGRPEIWKRNDPQRRHQATDGAGHGNGSERGAKRHDGDAGRYGLGVNHTDFAERNDDSEQAVHRCYPAHRDRSRLASMPTPKAMSKLMSGRSSTFRPMAFNDCSPCDAKSS